MFGRIHGLENIALLSDEDLKKIQGNPVTLQTLINNAKPAGPPATTFDGLISKAMCSLNRYKDSINQLSLSKSDRSKMLSLPFFASRRVQGPAPQRGQWQYDLFTELAGGKEWEHFDSLEFDPEHKITVYEFEKHIPPTLLEKLDTSSEEFKRDIKLTTLLSKTQYESHKDLQNKFRDLMNTFALLNEQEGRALVHLLKNQHRDNYLQDIHGGEVEALLAEIAEKENYAKKNQYMLNKRKLSYIQKERMPIEKTKIKDIFRHASDFKSKFNKEIGIYDTLPKLYDFDKRVIQYFYETARGPMMKLRDEIGLKDRLPLKFLRIKDMKELEERVHEDPLIDHGMFYLFNAIFLPLDVTDYDDHYVGFKEDRALHGVTTDGSEYLNPAKNIFDRNLSEYHGEWDDAPKPNFFRTSSQEERAAAMAGGDDDDEEGEGEEEEVETYKPARFADPDFKPEDFVEPEWPYKPRPKVESSPDYFNPGESIRDRFDDNEIESFMKFLDITPFRNWKSTSHYHNRIGFHVPEDFAQRVDPEYHMAGEVEREMFERLLFRKHRSGATVRFVVGDKKPRFGQ